MLSSLGFDSKGASRNNHSGSRLMPNVPKGFSVHVFKNPTLPTHSLAPMPPTVIPPKYDNRPPNGGGQWTRQQSYHAPLTTESQERKQLQAVPPSQDHRLIHVPAINQSQAWPVETKASRSKSAKSYGIYPSLVGDIYVYERSISSVSFDEVDDLASSPSSDSSSSSDSDLYDDAGDDSHNLLISNRNHTATYAHRTFNAEISSTRASSSTETLESTLTAARPLGTRPPNVASSLPPPAPLHAIAGPPRPASTRPQQQHVGQLHPERDSPTVAVARSAVALTRVETQTQPPSRALQRSISISAHAAVPPIQLASAPLENGSDSESETVISETHGNDMVVDMLGAQWAGSTAYAAYPMRSATPFRRGSDDRTYRAAAPAPVSARDPRDVPAPRPSVYREDSAEGVHPRAPPGLSGAVTSLPDAPRSPPRTTRDTSSSPTNTSPASRSPPSAPPPLRQSPAGAAPAPPMGSSSYLPPPPAPQPSSSGFPPPASYFPSSSPPRRAPSPQHNTPSTGIIPGAGPAQTPSPRGTGGNMNALVVAKVAKRSVRWTEDLVCPSPVLPEHRRKGWFNRRGDQLWTNDGQYKMPEPGTEYPPDLADYPEPNTGWMNEDGRRIDMQHRLVLKQPLRSALKRAKPLNA